MRNHEDETPRERISPEDWIAGIRPEGWDAELEGTGAVFVRCANCHKVAKPTGAGYCPKCGAITA